MFTESKVRNEYRNDHSIFVEFLGGKYQKDTLPPIRGEGLVIQA